MLLVDERETAFLLSNWAQSKVEELNRFSLIPEMCPFLLEQDMRICSVVGCNNKYHAKGLCEKHYREQWYQAHKEQVKLYQELNKEKRKKYRRNHYQSNREKEIEQSKQYNKNHKEQTIEYNKQYRKDNKEYYKQYRKDNKERIAKRDRQYTQDNESRIKKYQKQWYQTLIGKASRKASKARRRTLEKGLTLAIVQRVYDDNIKKYGVLTCCLCFKPIINDDDSLEHSIPLIREGSNDYENLGIAHLTCNLKKGTKTLTEWNNLTNNKKG